MTDSFEDLISSEARRQGLKVNADAMRAAVVDLAGGRLIDGELIYMPGRGSISPADFVRDLQCRMPHAFANLTEASKPELAIGGNVTEQMRQEIVANRRQRQLPSDWQAVRSRTNGVTAEHMSERERKWQ